MERKWPVYLTGPENSMHALGVVSVNFANFERAITWVFAAVSQRPEAEAREIHARKGTSECVKKIEQASRERGWSGIVDGRVRHFIAATRTLIDNRNLLMHSIVVGETLYKTSRGGDRQMLDATTAQIRAVADDLHRYFSFGRLLAKCIATKVDQAHHDWPYEPRAPKALLQLH
jgi:hypothetical protein